MFDDLGGAQPTHVLMQTKLYEMNLVIFHSCSEKSELTTCFMLKQHSFFTMTNINEIDEFETFVYLDLVNIILS